MKKIIAALFLLFVSLMALTISNAYALEPLSNSQIDKTAGIEDYTPKAILPPNYSLKSSAGEQIVQNGLTTTLPAKDLPNIVFILVDDQPPSLLGAAGNTTVKTPNIDGLANGGIYFKNMYVPLGICAPSRASIWTGKYPHSNGVTKNGLILPPDQITLPEILKANGYSTGIIGKCHLGDPENPEKYKRGFDFRLISYPDIGSLSDWYNYQFSRNGTIETYSNRYITDFLTDESVNFIKNNAQSGHPFFLWLAHFAPHRPTTPPKGQNLYNKDALPLPASITDDLSSKSQQVRDTTMHKTFLSMGTSGVRQELDDAYEVMSNVDSNVGRVLQTLTDLGIRKNTIVIYMSDNGFFYGEHQLERKGPTFYQEQMTVPFIFSYPSSLKAGRTSNALLSSVDILPTILDFLKIPIAPGIQGQSFADVLRGATAIKIRDSVFFEFSENQSAAYPNITWDPYPMRGVIFNNFKWIHYLASTTRGVTYDAMWHELYNLKSDPAEINNILKRLSTGDNALERMLKDPTYGKTIQNLRKELATWETDTQDIYAKKISNFKAVQLNSTTVELSWTDDTAGTAEIEYKDRNCKSCVVQELNNFNYAISHKETITIKPNIAYNIKVFTIGPHGNGGYVETQINSQGTLGDFNGDGKIDIFDYNLLVQDFGHPYTMSDYNSLVGNFGK